MFGRVRRRGQRGGAGLIGFLAICAVLEFPLFQGLPGNGLKINAESASMNAIEGFIQETPLNGENSFSITDFLRQQKIICVKFDLASHHLRSGIGHANPQLGLLPAGLILAKPDVISRINWQDAATRIFYRSREFLEFYISGWSLSRVFVNDANPYRGTRLDVSDEFLCTAGKSKPCWRRPSL